MVDDFRPWRRFASAALQKKRELQIVSEASDGLQAVREAEELQPDLILLDIGRLNSMGLKLPAESEMYPLHQEFCS